LIALRRTHGDLYLRRGKPDQAASVLRVALEALNGRPKNDLDCCKVRVYAAMPSRQKGS
jgi:hypothetical protein